MANISLVMPRHLSKSRLLAGFGSILLLAPWKSEKESRCFISPSTSDPTSFASSLGSLCNSPLLSGQEACLAAEGDGQAGAGLASLGLDGGAVAVAGVARVWSAVEGWARADGWDERDRVGVEWVASVVGDVVVHKVAADRVLQGQRSSERGSSSDLDSRSGSIVGLRVGASLGWQSHDSRSSGAILGSLNVDWEAAGVLDNGRRSRCGGGEAEDCGSGDSGDLHVC